MNRKSALLKTFLLMAAAVTTLSVPQQDSLEFEVATLKPNPTRDRIDPNVTATGCRGTDTKPDRRPERPMVPLGRCVFQKESLASLIQRAYALELPPGMRDVVTGGPDWVRSEEFDLVAKAADPATATGRDLYRMFRNLLEDRFKLKLHREVKSVSGYALLVSRNGPKLVAAKNTEVRPNVSGRVTAGLMTLIGLNASMDGLAGSLSTLGLGLVADKTDLQKTFDFELTFSLEAVASLPKKGAPPAVVPGAGPSLEMALEQQLGLRLVSQKLDYTSLIIESAEKPSPN